MRSAVSRVKLVHLLQKCLQKAHVNAELRIAVLQAEREAWLCAEMDSELQSGAQAQQAAQTHTMADQGQEPEAPMYQAANEHVLHADADVRERAVGRDEQEMFRKRKRQDVSSRSRSDASLLIAWSEGLTTSPRQPPLPSFFTPRQLSPVIDEETEEEEEHYLYDGHDGAEGADGGLHGTPCYEAETELVDWPHRGAQAQTAFQCLGCC